MAPVTPPEPQSAADYDDRTTAAVKAVLLEIGQILGSFRGKFAVIGGAVPWLLLGNEEMPHVGTLDVDLGLDAEALGDGEYATLIEALMGNGYQQRQALRRFQLVRQVPAADGGDAIDVIVDFLMPRDAEIVKNDPPLINAFAVQKASGADLALRFYQMVAIDGPMPGGGKNRVEIAVASIPALLAMKGFALHGRHKQKDAYDIYYCVRNYPDGIEPLAEACRPLLAHTSGEQGYRHIAEKFDDAEGYGPTGVRRFVEDTKILGGRTPEQWQQDAFGQVDAWLRALGLRDAG
ncbi:MAG: nucleotidyl transferase AbiEii/AbiGii toxin family protein [Alphaproteobacteria bacterium]|nr:nucleotidyl transferase AbiEii/AbiGii toxin family protein [Alphaproteobacteria bacterium]